MHFACQAHVLCSIRLSQSAFAHPCAHSMLLVVASLMTDTSTTFNLQLNTAQLQLSAQGHAIPNRNNAELHPWICRQRCIELPNRHGRLVVTGRVDHATVEQHVVDCDAATWSHELQA